MSLTLVSLKLVPARSCQRRRGGKDHLARVDRSGHGSERDDRLRCRVGPLGCVVPVPFSGGFRFRSAARCKLTAAWSWARRTEDIKGELLEMGILDVLLPLTDSPSVEVRQGQLSFS